VRARPPPGDPPAGCPPGTGSAYPREAVINSAGLRATQNQCAVSETACLMAGARRVPVWQHRSCAGCLRPWLSKRSPGDCRCAAISTALNAVAPPSRKAAGFAARLLARVSDHHLERAIAVLLMAIGLLLKGRVENDGDSSRRARNAGLWLGVGHGATGLYNFGQNGEQRGVRERHL
jgi:hypothetical protein